MGKGYEEQGNEPIANGFYNDAINNFKKALDLAYHAPEAHSLYVMALINVHKPDEALAHLEKMRQENIPYKSEGELLKMAQAAVYFREYELIKVIFTDLVEIAPQNPDYYINLALAYAYLGDDQKAIEIAESIKNINSGFTQQADLFIQGIKEGKFKEN